MYNFINIIQELMVNIRDIISGNTILRNSEIDRVRKNIYDIEIPTFKDDRTNLKKDSDTAVKAYSKAVQEKKLQLQD